MYEKDKTLLLVATASALQNNLSCKMLEPSRISEAISVVHGGFINVVPLKSASASSSSETSTISRYIPCSSHDSSGEHSASVTQVMWCNINYETCLVVASSVGIQVFDCATLDLRFSHSCKDSANDKGHFARGLANPSGNYLCVGNNVGVVRLFGTGEDGNLMFIDRKHGHGAPVSHCASSRDLLVSVDDAGGIILWHVTPDELLRWSDIASFGSAATSVQIWSNILIVGYGSGHIRLFMINEGRREVHLATEIAAHAKWITAVDVAPESGFILSVSEDSFAKIWQIVKGDVTSVVHRFSSQVKDSMLVGGKFLTLSGSLFAVSIYDSNLVQCFKM